MTVRGFAAFNLFSLADIRRCIACDALVFVLFVFLVVVVADERLVIGEGVALRNTTQFDATSVS